MAKYRESFDQLTPAAVQALNAKASEFSNAFYGTNVAYVRRLLERISAGLAKVDEGKVNHPTYLAGEAQPIPERALQLISSMPSAITDSGVTHFITVVLPKLVQVDEGLSKAAGINEIRSAEIKSSQLRAIERYLDWSKSAYTQTASSKSSAESAFKEIASLKSELEELAKQAKADDKKIKDIRATASRLSSGTKTTPSLSAFIKTAHEKLEGSSTRDCRSCN